MAKKPFAAGFRLPKTPARTPVPEPKAKAFEAAAPAPERAPSRLRRDERGERIAIYLPPELATRLRVMCATERRSVSDAITEAVTGWLESHGTPGPRG